MATKSTRFAKRLKQTNKRARAGATEIGKLVADAERQVVDSTTVAAKSTDAYVRDNPWKAICAAAVASLALGTILRR